MAMWEVRIGRNHGRSGEFHSSHKSYRDAVDQADMIHGEVLLRHDAENAIRDRMCHQWAVDNQGCELSWDEWTAQDDEERASWNDGAAGIGTV